MQDNTATIDTQQSDSLRNIVLGCYAASLLGPFISIGMLNVPVMLVAWFYSSRARDTAYEDHLKQLIQTPLICLVLMVVVIFTRILALPGSIALIGWFLYRMMKGALRASRTEFPGRRPATCDLRPGAGRHDVTDGETGAPARRGRLIPGGCVII